MKGINLSSSELTDFTADGRYSCVGTEIAWGAGLIWHGPSKDSKGLSDENLRLQARRNTLKSNLAGGQFYTKLVNSIWQ